jgi:hypothetical protein
MQTRSTVTTLHVDILMDYNKVTSSSVVEALYYKSDDRAIDTR